MKAPMRLCMLLVTIVAPCVVPAQTMQQTFDEFRKKAHASYSSFNDSVNAAYADFLRKGAEWYKGNAPLPRPADQKVKPVIYKPRPGQKPVAVTPTVVEPVKEEVPPQPKPVAPIRENPRSDADYFPVQFFGNMVKVRLPESARSILADVSGDAVADAWEKLSDGRMDNAIRDCLEARMRYGLCDWAYLSMLDSLAKAFCGQDNDATMLAAYLYCRSGYSMRFGFDSSRLVLLYESRHMMLEKSWFTLGDRFFYPLGECSEQIMIGDAVFPGETPLSLDISTAQKLGTELSEPRKILSKRYSGMSAESRVPVQLIKFFDTYPVSVINRNIMTKWSAYANTPLSQPVRESLYPGLKKSIEGLPPLQGAERLLNWVQTGLVYEYDDKVWGHDRAFFAEESLYYPYCDCEDRSILFSRLVRDLLGLDVALVFYPGHLATAVCFTDGAHGDSMTISGRPFTVCDPTYIGAPVGATMTGMDNSTAEVIILKK